LANDLAKNLIRRLISVICRFRIVRTFALFQFCIVEKGEALHLHIIFFLLQVRQNFKPNKTEIIYNMKLVSVKMLLVIALSLFILPVNATVELPNRVTLSGFVKDAQTGEELIGAVVYVKELKTGTSTNSYGFYSISLQTGGSYTIEYSYLGYQTQSRTVKLSEGTSLNVELAIDSKEIDEVIVNSNRKNENIKKVEMSTQKLEMKTIKQVPALMGEVDVVKVIQLLPGVTSTGEGTSSFSVRGGSADQNLILLDEATVYNASHLMGFFSVFNNDAVKDVKLYKGDLPVYAGGRLSSLLEVHMKDGNSKKFTGTAGIGTISSRLTIEGPIYQDKTTFLLSGRRTYADAYLPLSGKEEIKDNTLYFYDLNVKLTHRFNDNNRLYISGYLGKDKFENSFAGMGFGNSTLTTRWNHLFSKRLFSNLSFIYSNYNYNMKMSSGGDSDLDWKYNMQDLGVKYDFTFFLTPDNTVRFGYQGTHHTLNPGEVTSVTGAFDKYVLPSTYSLENAWYLSNEQNIGEKLSLKYGVRLTMFQNVGAATVYNYDENYKYIDSTCYSSGDYYNTFFRLSPRLGINYKINEVSSVKASYSRTDQFMQMASNSTAGTPLDLWFTASKNVKPQLADQYAIGYFRNFFDNQLETSVEFFYKDMKNTIDFRDHASLVLNKKLEGDLRFGKSQSYGAEVLLQKNTGKLTGWVSYTYSHTTRTIKDLNNGKSYLAPFDKPHNVSIVLSYEFNYRVSAGATWVYSTGQPMTVPVKRFEYGNTINPAYTARNEYRMPDYHRLDLSLTLKPKKREGRKFDGEWNFSIYNAYARHNAWVINFEQDATNPNVTKAMKTYLFTFLPSVSYNVKF
jgi:hypothetical protein